MKTFLKKNKPKAIFLGCYYTTSGFALSYISNVLKIPSIEIQHGQQGMYHPMYSNFKNMPKKGYQIMPKYFGMWNKKSEKVINKWAKYSDFHSAKVIGNPWFEVVNKNILNLILTLKNKNFIKKLKEMKQKGIVTILFSFNHGINLK